MIIKPFTVPLRIVKDKALLRRLPLQHPKRAIIEEDLAKRQVGYKGETAISYFLDKLPQQHLHIFNGLRIKNGKYHFQIDTLLLTPYLAIIIEIKTMAGTLFFNPKNKLFIRSFNNIDEGFDDPLNQAEEQQEQLLTWFKMRDITDLPVEYIIGISSPKTIIKAAPDCEDIYRFPTEDSLFNREKGY